MAKVLPSGNDKGTDQRAFCALLTLPDMWSAHARGADTGCGDAVTAHFTSLHAALTMLTGRLALLHGLLAKMAAGVPACSLVHC